MKLKIMTVCCVSDEGMGRNRLSCPPHPETSGTGHLAVVGGGPSLLGHVGDLRNWEGDIWGINGTASWLCARGIDAAFYSVDPSPLLVDEIGNVRRAVLADCCDPLVFQALSDAGCEVSVCRSPVLPGPTSAVASSLLAIRAGYERVTYFGCESNFDGKTHVHKHENIEVVRVKCGDASFLVKLEFLLQAEQLADVIRTFPALFSERSGGFLGALASIGDYDVTHVPRRMMPAEAII